MPSSSTTEINPHPVSYFFRIRGMQPLQRHDNLKDSQGRWLPPKKRGSNNPYTVPGATEPVSLIFYHNGARTFLLDPTLSAEVPSRTVRWKTYSLYHARSVLWTVNYDATRKKVGDGKHDADEPDEPDESSSESDEEQPYDNWTELTFGSEDARSSLSYAGCHMRERRLLAQGRHQTWAQHLIPDRYQSHNRATDARPGGLVGELPLLIGLAAMSLPVDRWQTILPQTIVRSPQHSYGWRIPQDQIDHVDRGSQWQEKRGVVVEVLRDTRGSSEAELRNYERGTYGPILA